MSNETKVRTLMTEDGQYNVTKKIIDAKTGQVLSEHQVCVNADWFDEKQDEDNEHFFLTGSYGEEEAFWISEV